MYAVTSALAAGEALIASTTCLAVVLSAPAPSVARLTVMSLTGTWIRVKPSDASVSAGSTSSHMPSVTVTDSGAFRVPAGGALNSAVMLLPPRWPNAFENSCTARERDAAAAIAAALVPVVFDGFRQAGVALGLTVVPSSITFAWR